MKQKNNTPIREADIDNQFALTKLITDASCTQLEIDSLAKLILLCVVNRANKDTGWISWPSQKTLMDATGIQNVKTIRKWTKQLIDCGYISTVQIKSNDPSRAYNSLTYTVLVKNIITALNGGEVEVVKDTRGSSERFGEIEKKPVPVYNKPAVYFNPDEFDEPF